MIKIIRYNPVTGNGTYQKANGEKVRFSYKKFQNEKAVWPGSLARIKEGKITKAIPLTKIIWIAIKLFFDIKRYVS